MSTLWVFSFVEFLVFSAAGFELGAFPDPILPGLSIFRPQPQNYSTFPLARTEQLKTPDARSPPRLVAGK